MIRARESRNVTQSRESQWNLLEHSLTAYVPKSEKERLVQEKDSRKPVSVVVPVTYAALDTLMTYWVGAFLKEPLFPYRGVGPEDMIGAAVLEQVIATQARRAKMGLDLYTMWRDALVYGFGAMTLQWEVTKALRPVAKPRGVLSTLGSWLNLGGKEEAVETVVFEGNRLAPIDPYMLLPDPNVPITAVQRGEYVGWGVKENYPGLLSQEVQSDGAMFNVKYLKDASGSSSLWTASMQARDRFTPDRPTTHLTSRPIYVIYMYINLIPAEWGLGELERPQKWLFGIGEESIVLRAEPCTNYHGMFPAVICAPDSDGHSAMPTSKLEVSYGLQMTVDWLLSSHITNVRKALNDMFIVDPLRINMEDARNPGPGRFIRLREGAWGTGVEGAIKQFPVSDVTQQHIANIPLLLDLIQRSTGVVDIVQGIMRSGGERRSAEEARGARLSALSRLERMSRLGSMQAHWDLQYMLASQTQQYISESGRVNAVGQLAEVLEKERSKPRGSVRSWPFSPTDLLVDYDIMPADGGVLGGEFADTWVQLLQTVLSGQTPAAAELQQRLDVTRLFLHAARIMGAKNIEDFLRTTDTPMQMQVVPNEQAGNMAASGELVPMEQMANEY